MKWKRLSMWVGVLAIASAIANDSGVQADIVRVAQKSPRRGQSKKQPPKSKIPRGQKKQRPPVAKVNPASLSKVRSSAAKIDSLVRSLYVKNAIEPETTTTDSQFVRRIYLDVTGTIPTLAQTRRFLSSKDKNKRSQLIDELLNSPGYVSHHFNYWGNILRLVDRPNNNVLGQPYHEWIKKSLRDNVAYDKMVTRMLTAEGKAWDDGATGYIFRDSGMELDAMNNTVRVFLGTRIGCAQCHDHPFDRWTQREFYQMAAFMYGTRSRDYAGNKAKFGKNPSARLRAELKKMDPKANTGGVFNRLITMNYFEVFEQKNRRLKLPHDYQYDDGKPGQVVKAATIFGTPVKLSSSDSPRQTFSKWLTSPDNPRFAKTIANRMWKKAFGVGLIEPVDDMTDDSQASNPELMKFLIAEMKRVDFDLKEFQRIIFNTRTWQRQAYEREIDFSQPYYFPAPILRRMTAEQAWDSLLTLAVYDVESFERTSFQNVKQSVELDLKNATAKQVQNKAGEYNEKYNTGALRKADRQHSYKGMVLARASELPLPVPANHFLRQFGQGDRQLIDGANTDGSVSQILTMFNGQITHMMLESGSVIYDNLVKARSSTQAIDIIFLSILNRKPTSSELDVARKEVAGNRKATVGIGNIVWALINTKEFLFIQ